MEKRMIALLQKGISDNPDYFEMQYLLSALYTKNCCYKKSNKILFNLLAHQNYSSFFTYKYANNLFLLNDK
jgi:hypothetical protein